MKPLVASAFVIALSLPSRGLAFVPPPEPVDDEAQQHYERTERQLVGATAGLGASSGALLIIGLALHGAAISTANRCATEILANASTGGSFCDDELGRMQRLVVGRNVALVGFGLTAVGMIVTGSLLGVHRSRGPRRVATNSTGLTIRF